MEIKYQLEPNLSVEEFRDVLERSTLAERRPIEDENRLEKMLRNANLIITARNEGNLVGISRGISDFSFCTYLSDLAVDVDFQHLGIGKRMIVETKKQAPDAKLILLAAPKAISYYPKIGMEKYEHCFIIDDANQIKL